MIKKLAVIALGGNALLRSGQKGTIEEQRKNVYETCNKLLHFVEQDYNIVIGHGNGPQVGNVLLGSVAGNKLFGLPMMPLDICGSFTQGHIGYLIEQQFSNLIRTKGFERQIVTLVTQVVVSKSDPAFSHPSKPIGPYYTEAEKDVLIGQHPEDSYAADPKGRGFRKVVASPQPLEIQNIHLIKRLAEEGNIVIASGGGGIPVVRNENGDIEGIEAVIDKDLALALLATKLRADELYILTDVQHACLYFNTSQEIPLNELSIADARQYLIDGHFSEGSMAPKIRAALYFIENGGSECIITDAAHLHIPNAGTRIRKLD
ncbi:MAG: carbamate kinase [Bacteroidales bacterium]|nr:carbamate kinase [Bacteroidales bacterium]